MRCRHSNVKFTRHPDIDVEPWRARFTSEAGELAEDPLLLPLLRDLAASIREARAEQVLTVSVAGSQGSGKTTMTHLLARLSERYFGVKTAVLSLDDFYLPRAERQRLAAEIHPLLETRGVPGTHDISLMSDTLAALRARRAVRLPRFDKATDDRATEWSLQSPVDVVLCEGWCWGAQPQPAEALDEPINQLEARQDPEGRWRLFVNESLAAYQDAFRADGSVFLRAPSMEAVFRWRWQQEQDLAAMGRTGAGIMSETQIRGFVAYYERITRWMLEIQPGNVDVCINLLENHRIGDARGFR